jgi:putative transposase
MEDAPMASRNTAESGTVRSAEPEAAQRVDDQLIDELVGRARAEERDCS